MMTEIPPDLAAFATAELRRRGMEIRTGTTIERVTRPLRRALGRRGRSRRARWRGPRASSRIRWSPSSACRSTAAAASPPTASAGPGPARRLGDRRRRRGARPGAQGQPVAADGPARAAPGQGRGRQRRHALGRRAGRRRPFRYRTLGVFVDMGRHQAVASTLGIKWRGFPAWFLARTYHLALMPGRGAPRAARDRLDGRAAVRARLGRARPARPSARAGATSAGGTRRAQSPAATKSSAAPAFASTTERARRHSFIRFGGTARSTRTGAPSLPSQIRSSGKRIVNVCTERQRGMCSA